MHHLFMHSYLSIFIDAPFIYAFLFMHHLIYTFLFMQILDMHPLI